MPSASLDRREKAVGVADGLADGLAAVDDEEQRAVGGQPALDEAGEQRLAHRRVLRRALPQPQDVLAALGVDPEGDEDGLPADLDAVDEQREEPERGEVAGAQLGELGRGALDEAARDRGASGPAGPQLAADGLQALRIVPGGQAREHPPEGGLGERVALGHGGVCRKRQLLPVAAAGARPLDLDEPAAEGDEAALRAVAVRGALRVVLPLGADEARELGLEELPQDQEAGGDREREQVLLGGTREISEGERDLRGHVDVGEALPCDDAGTRYLGHGGPPFVVQPHLYWV